MTQAKRSRPSARNQHPRGVRPSTSNTGSKSPSNSGRDLRRSNRVRNQGPPLLTQVMRPHSFDSSSTYMAMTEATPDRVSRTYKGVVEESNHIEPQSSVFPLMKLPTELRLHIFRAALVRPYPIALHKEPPPASVVPHSDRSTREIEIDTLSSDSDPEMRPSGISRQAHSGRHRRQIVHSDVLPNNLPELPDNTWQHLLKPREPLPQDVDPLNPAILRLSKAIYEEARQVLYGENVFDLRLRTAIYTIGSLHQRARSSMRHVRLMIPGPSEIMDGFSDVVRVSLRYCWKLQKFTILVPFRLTADYDASRGSLSVFSTVNQYATLFNILRWLPKNTEVLIEGDVCEEIKDIISRNATLAKSLDEVSRASTLPTLQDFHD